MLAIRTGNPHDTEPWEWRGGFYSGSEPGECRNGTSAGFKYEVCGLQKNDSIRTFKNDSISSCI